MLRSSLWGWILPKPDGPEVLGLSPTIVLIFAGLLVLWLFAEWERRIDRRGGEPLVQLSMFANRQFTGGPSMFFFQFLVQAGMFFTIPLYLSVALGLSAIDTGIRIMPPSITLLIAGAEIVTVPLLLAGLGIGALASQLGAVTVSTVPDEQSPDVGSLQNTATNFPLALVALIALFFSRRIPTEQPASDPQRVESA